MIGEEQLQVNNDGTLTISCKIPAQWLPLLQTICRVKNATMNDLMKMCLQFVIETARVSTDPSPDMKVLLHMMRIDSNWKSMFSYVTKAKLDIAQVILVLQQAKSDEPREGFGLAMFNKPFMGDCTQTLSADEITERVLEVAMGKSPYWNMRQVAANFDAQSIREALVRMVDAQDIIIKNAEDNEEMPGYGDYVHYNGYTPRQGGEVRTKQRQKRDIDWMDQQQTIQFDENDKAVSDEEAEQSRQWLRDNNDFEPHGEEW